VNFPISIIISTWGAFIHLGENILKDTRLEFLNERKDIPVEYGITRNMNPHNFLDVYFGEIAALARDVKNAPGLKNKFLYIIMPPGWCHSGEHKTASTMRKEFLNGVNDSTAI